ncbi:MAG: RNA 2'-phosphotransferase [Crenarchaeota archaeon]|nr:RNA 2'-phosphotransferase [Thermoproteota archaeon]
MDERTRISLSKKMTYLLRHSEGFTDSEGWAEIGKLVRELRKFYPWVTEEHVLYVASKDEKGRYEVKGDKIRARYGHTVKYVRPTLEEVEEEVLYHGTSCEAAKKILREGIKPMRRNFVHLTTSLEEAVENARRKGRCIEVLVVDGRCLRERGIKLYKGGKHVRVCEWVPPECVRPLS